MANFVVVTVNVNGLRAAVKKGMGKWFESQRKKGLDVLCLQETKIAEKNIKELAQIYEGLGINSGDFHLQENANKSRQGGSAIWVNPDTCQTLLPKPKQHLFEGTTEAKTCDFSGRWQEILIKFDNQEIMIVNSYYHSANSKSKKTMDNKHKFFAETTKRMRELTSMYTNLVLVGDINTAHHDIDLKNFEGNKKMAGFLPEERAWLDLWFTEKGKPVRDLYKENPFIKYTPPPTKEFEDGGLGLHDVIRDKYGDGKDGIIYSMWSWRGRQFDRNAGRRIDYQIASKNMAEFVKTMPEIYGYGHVTYKERWSDHAPVVVTYSM